MVDIFKIQEAKEALRLAEREVTWAELRLQRLQALRDEERQKLVEVLSTAAIEAKLAGQEDDYVRLAKETNNALLVVAQEHFVGVNQYAQEVRNDS